MKKVLALIAASGLLLVLAATVGSSGADACCPEPPSNDNFNEATVVDKLPFSDIVDTVEATTATNDPDIGNCSSGGGGYSHSIWFTYTPGFDQRLDFDTFGSNFDTVLAVFTGTKDNLNQVACNDDSAGQQSAIKITLQAATTYYFLAASWATGGPGGSLHFNITPQDPVLYDDVALKCYQAKLAKRSARFQRQEIYTLDLNNGIETETDITGLLLYCNQAGVKFARSGTTAGGDYGQGDLKTTCYRARDTEVEGKGARGLAGRTVFAQNELFGDQKLTLSRLESVCVLAVKRSGVLPGFTPFNGDILRCYTARPVKGSPRAEAVPVSIGDQFDSDKGARVLRPVSYCTISSKNQLKTCAANDCHSGAVGGTNGQDPDEIPFDYAVVCYSVRQAGFRAFNIPVIDQFLDQQFIDPYLTIKKADRLCLSSVKKYPFAGNDDFDNAISVSLDDAPCAATNDFCPFHDHVVTLNATRARNDPPMYHCESVADSDDYSHSVWYTLTPSDPLETDININTFGSTYDTVLAIYTGSKGNLTQIYCDDDGGSGLTSNLDVLLDEDVEYWIMVGAYGRNGVGGKLKLNVSDNVACAGPCD